MKITVIILATIGTLTILYGIIGLISDITTFDQTKGGYDYPYEGWTGKPVAWDEMDITSTGLVKRGHVVDVHVNGTTGMISFSLIGMTIDWQTFSDRALKVHRPREAFLQRGFHPEF